MVIIIIIGIIILFILITTIQSYRNNKMIKKNMKLNWGRPPVRKSYDGIDSVSTYWNHKFAHQPPELYIDDITWNDLDMDDVYMRLNATNSSVGAEYLYAKLHEPDYEIPKIKEIQQLIEYINSNEKIRLKIQFHLAQLGKSDYNMTSDFIFSPNDKRLKYQFLYTLLAVFPIISLLLFLIDLKLAVFLLIASLSTNVILYYKNKNKLETKLAAATYITLIVICASRLSKLKDDKLQTFFYNITTQFNKLKKIIRFSKILLSKPTNEMDFILEYIKIIFMLDFISYNRFISTICKNSEAFYQLWEEIGKLDTAISIASYRHSVDFYTAPTFTSNNDITSENMYHPLVDNPICNPVTLSKNSIITGSNASGKSTYIKAVAINSIFAQTICTCLASSFSLKPSLVITSMAVRDNVIDGDSYFIAEIKSLKRILNALNDNVRCLCFVDEILKGTNTIERISASTSILNWLADKNCLCIIASHDIELTEILKNLYDNYHFRELMTDQGMSFDYKIHSGFTTTRNAIKLLEFMDYPNSIVLTAQNLAEDFETTRKWKSIK
jgi:DNA mismatch repair ATPase MutS